MRQVLIAPIVVLAMGVAMTSTAGQLGGVVDATKKAGEVTKEAGKATGEVAKETGKTTKEVATKGVEKTEQAVTGKAHAKCADGTEQTAKTEKEAKAACAQHGGVAKP
jgi:hypothetical protein